MQLRVFKVKAFARWAKKQKIKDLDLLQAVGEMRRGLFDADLGSGVYKKRLSVKGRGKRGGARIIIAFNTNKHTFFLFGFMKNERDSIDRNELEALRKYADTLFMLSDEQLEKLISNRNLFEIG